MIYLVAYLGLGACFLLTVRTINTLSKRNAATRDHPALPRSQGKFDIVDDALLPALGCAFIIVSWPVIALWMVKDKTLPKADTAARAIEEPFSVARRDLIAQTTIDEIEQCELVDDPLGAVPAVPFGHLHERWGTFSNEVHPRDTIWSFAANRTDNWGIERRRYGYVCVRDDKIGQFVVTRTEPSARPRAIADERRHRRGHIDLSAGTTRRPATTKQSAGLEHRRPLP
ncbi:hypothetical protein [Cupriavidus sp. DF5525]|uniref:hypothetical protein n=1 Tax=Cupriavidus sp. DF5525 TaxID=3160989 RepID=UPI0032DFB1EC